MRLHSKLYIFSVALLLTARIYAAEAPIKLRVAYPTLTASYAVTWITKGREYF